MLIRDATFVVVDTETTGTNAESDRLLEVAAVKVVNGEVVDRYSELINPQQTIPRRITRLTGISTGMVFDKPTAASVLPGFVDFLADGIFVAHNLSFDLRFLNAELARIDIEPILNRSLCTLRLARRLMPGLPSKGLTALAKFYGLQIEHRHRAFGDAEATATILERFLSQLVFEHNLDQVEDLLHFQHRSYHSSKKGPSHLKSIRDEILPKVPDRPGVYFMKDKHGALIYIGKAKSLRNRLRSYFSGIESHPKRTRDLVHTVRDLQWEETGSELSALLIESKLIKEHKPKFNRAQRRYRNRPFIRLDKSHDAPSIKLSSYVQDDGAEYFGPLGGRRQAELVVDIINHMYQLRECDENTFRQGHRCMYASFGRCQAPCEGGQAAEHYLFEVERVRAFLKGQDHSVLPILQDKMKEAAGRQAYEEAAEYRDWYNRLERILTKRQGIASSVLEHNAVLVQPGTSDGTKELFIVRYGRQVEKLSVTLPMDESAKSHLRACLRIVFGSLNNRPAQYQKKEIEEVHILAHWLYVHRDSAHSVLWESGVPLDSFLEAVVSGIQ